MKASSSGPSGAAAATPAATPWLREVPPALLPPAPTPTLLLLLLALLLLLLLPLPLSDMARFVCVCADAMLSRVSANRDAKSSCPSTCTHFNRAFPRCRAPVRHLYSFEDSRKRNSRLGPSQRLTMFKADLSSASECLACSSTFGLIKRKHNCDACGFVFCSNCLKKGTCVLCVGKEKGACASPPLLLLLLLAAAASPGLLLLRKRARLAPLS